MAWRLPMMAYLLIYIYIYIYASFGLNDLTFQSPVPYMNGAVIRSLFCLRISSHNADLTVKYVFFYDSLATNEFA